jgi:squalene-associated FAD-dependent desaturase
VSPERIAVVGGGWAGLAAAVTLAGAGRRVTIFESAPALGGRARRVDVDAVTIDNGQHILLGAYHQTLALLQIVHRTGAERDLVRRQRLYVEEPGGFCFRTPPLPAPWHALTALLTMRGVALADRLATVAFVQRLRRTRFRGGAQLTVAALLADQPREVVRKLWEPLCIAALNTPTHRASAQIFLNTIRATFAENARHSDLLLPLVDLSALFPNAAARYVIERGGQICIGRSVTGIALRDDAIELTSGIGSDRYAACVIAVGPHQLEALLSNVHTPQVGVALGAVAAFAYEPIRTVYLRYPVTPPLSRPMLKLDGRPGQWLFDRGQLGGEPGLVAAVISTDVSEARTDHPSLARAIDAQIRLKLPVLAEPIWSQVIAERRATYACVAGLVRPLPGRLGPRLYLAGDYTDPELPATLEAATRSGVSAARSLLAGPE